MSSAGRQFLGDQIPGELIAKDVAVSDSSAVTSEAVVMTVVARVVSGRTYEVRFWGNVRAETGDRVLVRIREDSLAGDDIQTSDLSFDTGTGSVRGRPTPSEAEFTATSSVDKTFVVTLERILGSGTVVLEAGADHPAYLRVYYQEG